MENAQTGSVSTQTETSWQRLAFIAAILMLVALAGWMVISQFAGSLVRNRQAAALATFEEQTGVRILRVVMTSGGGMVDIQYQVLNPDKALIVHDDDNPPTLVDEANGLLIATPFHEHSFRELHTAVTYHEIIMNSGGLLQRGSRITLTIGEAKLEHMIVQ